MFGLHLTQVLQLFGRILRYPSEETLPAVETLYVILQHEVPLAAKAIAAFGENSEQRSVAELEECYTSTFEIKSKCAPEIGWHLFGEEFTRGMLLVRMREELERYGIPETTELPDHISHVLALVAAMPREEADRFVPACLLPAIRKMCESANRMGTPYAHVLDALDEVLRSEWGALLKEAEEGELTELTPGVDPLHAFPVLGAGEGSGCGGGCSCSDQQSPVLDPREWSGEQESEYRAEELRLPTDPRLNGEMSNEN